MSELLRFPALTPPEENHEFHLSDLLLLIGVEVLDEKGSFRCLSCKTVWGRLESDSGPFDRWVCPKGCNVE
jgi:hypothetical protein